MKQRVSEAGYTYVRYLGNGEHLLRFVESNSLEVWFANIGHASFGLIWRNTHLEFARSY